MPHTTKPLPAALLLSLAVLVSPISLTSTADIQFANAWCRSAASTQFANT